MTARPSDDVRKRKYLIVPNSDERLRRARAVREAVAPALLDRDHTSDIDLELRAWERCGRSRRELIAEAAYFRAERRGFTPTDPVADWLAAQAEIDEQLARS